MLPRVIYGGSAIGINSAKKGGKHHWRVKFEQTSDERRPSINIGIVDKDKAHQNMLGWWQNEWGYSYYDNGTVWNGRGLGSKAYGGRIISGDVMDIWLDLKNTNTLSYVKNDVDYGVAFEIPDDKEYVGKWLLILFTLHLNQRFTILVEQSIILTIFNQSWFHTIIT